MFKKKIEPSQHLDEETKASVRSYANLVDHAKKFVHEASNQLTKAREHAVATHRFTSYLNDDLQRQEALLTADSKTAVASLRQGTQLYSQRVNCYGEELEQMLKEMKNFIDNELSHMTSRVDEVNKRAKHVAQLKKKGDANTITEDNLLKQDCKNLVSDEENMRKKFNHLLHKACEEWLRITQESFANVASQFQPIVEHCPAVPDVPVEVSKVDSLSLPPPRPSSRSQTSPRTSETAPVESSEPKEPTPPAAHKEEKGAKGFLSKMEKKTKEWDDSLKKKFNN